MNVVADFVKIERKKASLTKTGVNKIMSNGMEDLHEKNRDKPEIRQDPRYDTWRTFQGREDAEMLQEKSAGWSSKRASRGEYDSWEED